MRARTGRSVVATVFVAALGLLLTSCALVVDGRVGFAKVRDANLGVKGVEAGSSFDRLAQNSLSDVEAYWRSEYPKISGGKRLEPITGGLYSVDGEKVARTLSAAGQPVENNACAEKAIGFLVDNAAYCLLDDSIVWDRSQQHLFAQLARKYGDFVVAMIFAHEFGHAVQQRLGVFDDDPDIVDTESQADCAAGAWAAAAIDKRAPHFRDVTLAELDDALEGFLNGRDSTPENIDEISHGNGFDRLSAVADGFDRGAKYCFSAGYYRSRTFTERPYSSDSDAANGGNVSLADVLDTSSNNPFVNDLNRFWTSQARSVGKTFAPVKIAVAEHPTCGAQSATAEIGYCPDDNTVYISRGLASRAYHSLPDVRVDKANGNVTLLSHQPADFALGTMFSIGWGLAVRHQLFGRTLNDKDALVAGICYTGAYAKDVNRPAAPGTFALSPADLDEGVAALLDEVPKAAAYGARGTTGLDRIQDFIKGYKSGLSSC